MVLVRVDKLALLPSLLPPVLVKNIEDTPQEGTEPRRKPQTFPPNSTMLTFSLRSHLKTLTQALTSITQSRLKLGKCQYPTMASSYSTKHQNNEDKDSNEAVLLNSDPTRPPRLFVVQPRLRPDTFLQAKLNEALCLANSLEEQRDGYFEIDFFDKALPPYIIVQNPILRSSGARAGTYFGPGTVENVKCHLYATESKGEVDAVFVNSILTGIQQRNLERAWGKPVLDRVGLIIEIFNAHAHTKEAKLQAQLAALMYKRSRLVRVRGHGGRLTFGLTGETEVVSARGRGSGGRGFISGAGETELQLQRRRLLEQRDKLLCQIEKIRCNRTLNREARKRHDGSHNQGLVTIAVVGYTNAGKSTLVSALSESDLYSDSRLFATLDPRLRSVILPSGRKVLLSDTVGFISDLPLQLVQAFHATLEEVVEADLLLHVIDSTAPNLDEHRSTVLQVLQQIGVPKEKLDNMIEVWNKIDYEEEMAGAEHLYDGEALSVDDDESVASQLSAEEEGEGDFEKITDDEQGDYSDGWLISGDDQEMLGDNWLKTLDNQQDGVSNDLVMEKDTQSQAQPDPHLKISALTGIGLKELLEHIDERLKTQDEKSKSNHVVQRGFFYQKWRPPHTEDSG